MPAEAETTCSCLFLAPSRPGTIFPPVGFFPLVLKGNDGNEQPPPAEEYGISLA